MRTSDAVHAFIQSRLARNCSPNTIHKYEWAIGKLMSFQDDLPSSSAELDAFMVAQHGYSNGTKEMLVSTLRVFFRWCAGRGYMDEGVVRDFKVVSKGRKIPRVLSRSEIAHLLSSIDDPRDYAIIALLLDTGIRIGELASLTPERVTLDSVTVSGKTGDRVIPISPQVYEIVMRQSDGTGLFKSGAGGYMTRAGLNLVVRRCMRKAGFRPPGIGPHTLRHTFATQHIIKGGDAFSLQMMLGHTKIETTQLYVRMTAASTAKQHEEYGIFSDVVGEKFVDEKRNLPVGWAVLEGGPRDDAEHEGEHADSALPCPCCWHVQVRNKDVKGQERREKAANAGRQSGEVRRSRIAERNRRICQMLDAEEPLENVADAFKLKPNSVKRIHRLTHKLLYGEGALTDEMRLAIARRGARKGGAIRHAKTVERDKEIYGMLMDRVSEDDVMEAYEIKNETVRRIFWRVHSGENSRAKLPRAR